MAAPNEASSQKKGSSCTYISFILIPVLLALVSPLLFHGISAPPSHFGSGSMFDRIATRYDGINRILALNQDISWRRRLAQLIQQHKVNDHILDVATGTADVALQLQATMPEATILGIDPSANMLDIGRSKIANTKIRLELHDAQDLHNIAITDFGAATMAFGIRNVPDRARALCQVHGKLAKGAPLGILEFSKPSGGLLQETAALFIRHVIPFLGGILSGRPREYWHLQQSIADFPSPDEFGAFVTNLEDCQFEMISRQELMFGSVQIYMFQAVRQE